MWLEKVTKEASLLPDLDKWRELIILLCREKQKRERGGGGFKRGGGGGKGREERALRTVGSECASGSREE